MSSDPQRTVAEDCGTCGDPDNEAEVCAVSKRPCGHHCNHVQTHDACDWCGSTWGEGGIETKFSGSFWPEFPWPKPEGLSKVPDPDALVPTAMCGYPKVCPWCPSHFLCSVKVGDERAIIKARASVAKTGYRQEDDRG